MVPSLVSSYRDYHNICNNNKLQQQACKQLSKHAEIPPMKEKKGKQGNDSQYYQENILTSRAEKIDGNQE